MESSYKLPIDNFPLPASSDPLYNEYLKIYNAIRILQDISNLVVPVTNLSDVSSTSFSASALAGRLVYEAGEALVYGNWCEIRPDGKAYKYQGNFLKCVSGNAITGNKKFPVFFLYYDNAGNAVCTAGGIVAITSQVLVPGELYALSGQSLLATSSTNKAVYPNISLAGPNTQGDWYGVVGQALTPGHLVFKHYS